MEEVRHRHGSASQALLGGAPAQCKHGLFCGSDAGCGVTRLLADCRVGDDGGEGASLASVRALASLSSKFGTAEEGSVGARGVCTSALGVKKGVLLLGDSCAAGVKKGLVSSDGVGETKVVLSAAVGVANVDCVGIAVGDCGGTPPRDDSAAFVLR